MGTLPLQEKSFWREFYPQKSLYPELSGNKEVDVAIIGAGITGLTAAYLLKRSGCRVAVIEKHTVAGGTSGRTTGKVTSQHGIFYDDLQKRLGQGAAALYGQANQTAIQQVENNIRNEGITCDWQRDDNYVFTTEPKQIDTFKKEARAAASLGLPATFETDTPLPFAVKAAVKFSGQGKINAQKYLLGLAKAVDGDGSFVFENSTVIGIREGKPGRVKTWHGQMVAKNIIVASSVPTFPLIARVAYAAHEYPSESYLVAGVTDKKLPGMYISPDKNHYSILPIKVGGKHMLLVGGEGHFWGLRGNRKARFERLARYAEEHFGVHNILNKWSDRDYIAYDGVPLVGPLYPWSRRLYVGTAFKKWGLSNGTAAGIMLHDYVLGKDNPWAKVFTTNRFTLFNRFRRSA